MVILPVKGREMSRREQDSVVQQSERVTLYKDQVIRKTGKVIIVAIGTTGNETLHYWIWIQFQADKELTLITEKVTKTLSSGRDSVSVELSGYRKKSPKATAVVNFQITLSSPYWSYHSSEQTLRLTLYVIDSKKRVKKYYVLKMQSREQLAAWVAELIQASTLVRDLAFQHLFHATIPFYEGGAVRTRMCNKHVVFQLRHPSDSSLVVRDPLSMADVRYWDISRLQNLTFEFLPHLTLSLKPRQAPFLPPLRADFIFFQSVVVVQLAVAFVESFCQNKLPDVYDRFRKRVFHRDTEQGASIKAVAYDLKQGGTSSAPKRSMTINTAYLEPQGGGGVSDFVQDSGASELRPSRQSDRFGLSRSASSAMRNRKAATVLLHPVPPRDLIRPGLVVHRCSSRDQVQMLAITPTLLRRQVGFS